MSVRSIHNIPVLGQFKDIASILKREQIEQVVVAVENVTPEELRTIVAQCEAAAVRVNIAPSVSEVVSGRVSVSALRPIQIEDLLTRELVRLPLPGDAAAQGEPRRLIRCASTTP